MNGFDKLEKISEQDVLDRIIWCKNRIDDEDDIGCEYSSTCNGCEYFTDEGCTL